MIRSEVEALINTNLEDFSNIVPEKHREVARMLVKAYPYPGELKDVMMPTASISIYFDTSGLGKVGKEYEGFAIRNGNNGTDDAGGLVDIGYKPIEYPTLGATGGEKTHTLTTSEIPPLTASVFTITPWSGQSSTGGGFEGGDNLFYSNNNNINTNGGGLAHNNMQPYRVVLKLMAL